jgi:hypothetical protein
MISIVRYLGEQDLASLKRERDPVQYTKIITKTTNPQLDDEPKEEVKTQLRKFNGKFIKKFIQSKQE